MTTNHDADIVLPPLPAPLIAKMHDGDFTFFDEDQMRDYAIAAVQLDRKQVTSSSDQFEPEKILLQIQRTSDESIEDLAEAVKTATIYGGTRHPNSD
jgi:hypothetical protein